MKIFKCILAAAMLLTVTSAKAQFIDTDNYTRVQVSFIANKISNHQYPGEPKGISLGVLQGYSVSDDLPLFLELGVNLAWSHSAEDYAPSVDYRFTNMHFAIPVNIAYKYTLNDKVSFSAHAGINNKVNFMALEKSSSPIFMVGTDASKVKASSKRNLLSKDDMLGRDGRANVYQLGGQIGLGVHLTDFYVGWQFQSDFMRFVELPNGDKQRLSTNYVTIGYSGELLPF